MSPPSFATAEMTLTWLCLLLNEFHFLSTDLSFVSFPALDMLDMAWEFDGAKMILLLFLLCCDLWEREGVFGLLVLKGRGKGEMVKTHAIKNWESGQHESWVFWRLDFGLWLVWIMNRCLAQVFPLLIYSFSLFRCL